MSPHFLSRITSLRNLVSSGLHESNLDKLVRECDELLFDGQQVLLFFVLKHLFSELSTLLDGQPVSVEAHRKLTQNVSAQIFQLLDGVERGLEIKSAHLEELIQLCLGSKAVFKAN